MGVLLLPQANVDSHSERELSWECATCHSSPELDGPGSCRCMSDLLRDGSRVRLAGTLAPGPRYQPCLYADQTCLNGGPAGNRDSHRRKAPCQEIDVSGSFRASKSMSPRFRNLRCAEARSSSREHSRSVSRSRLAVRRGKERESQLLVECPVPNVAERDLIDTQAVGYMMISVDDFGSDIP
jgi:hypothetical protein